MIQPASLDQMDLESLVPCISIVVTDLSRLRKVLPELNSFSKMEGNYITLVFEAVQLCNTFFFFLSSKRKYPLLYSYISQSHFSC